MSGAMATVNGHPPHRFPWRVNDFSANSIIQGGGIVMLMFIKASTGPLTTPESNKMFTT